MRAYLVQFLNKNDEHAIFNAALDLSGPHAPYSLEILNFPEFYLYRLLYNYLLAFEARGLAVRLSVVDACNRLLLPARQYSRLILRHNDASLIAKIDLSVPYLHNIEIRLRAATGDGHLYNRIDERI